MAETVDVVVIGLGPGGEHLAGSLAEAGLAVVGVERELVGGECPYWACVPTKMMVRAADALTEARRVNQLAGTADVKADFAPVARRIREEATDDWNDRVAVDRLVGKGMRFVRGSARLSGPREVTVDGQVFQARHGVVVATGTVPVVPAIEGLAGTPYWTNRGAVQAKEQPASLAVLGGGPIGLEIGQAFARFGTDVTVLETNNRILAVEEPESSALLHEVLTEEGLTLRPSSTVTRVEHDGRMFTVVTGGEAVRAEQLLVATGRRANLSELGLDTIGLDPTARWLEVDEHQQALPGLWAIGDVVGKGAFTHLAMYQAEIAIRAILGRPGGTAAYHAVPRVTFTDPEVGSVGLTETQARTAGRRVRTGLSQLPSSSRGWIHAVGNQGFIKLVEDADRGVLLGATSVGPSGGEVLSMLTLAVHARIPTSALRAMIYAYPTFHRAVEDALRELDHSPIS